MAERGGGGRSDQGGEQLRTPGRPGQRERFLDGAVEQVLRNGIGTLSLRPLAAALGTSDRMLLYYFGTRDALLAAILDHVGTSLMTGMTTALPHGRVRPDRLLAAMWTLATDPANDPPLRLYLEVLGLASARREPFASAAAQVGAGWLAWAQDHVDVEPECRSDTAAGVLAVFDGLLMVRFGIGADESDRAARWALPPGPGEAGVAGSKP